MVVVRSGNVCEASAYKTPIQIPNKNVPKCSLLCALEFIYPQSEAWAFSITAVKKKYINFTANNDKLTRTDVKYNGLGYQLERIEFFLPGIHRVNCVNEKSGDDTCLAYTDKKTCSETKNCSWKSDSKVCAAEETSCTPSYDVEMVLYHKALSWTEENQKWLNISVFVTPMYTYSLSQDFFEQLISAAKGNIALFKEDGAKQQTEQYDFIVEPKSSWSPYQAIPHRKSFYIYKGDMPYKPCRHNNSDEIVWVVMEHTVPMHFSEYDILKDLYRKPGTDGTLFPYNAGENYSTFDLNGRAVYYNDGSFVQSSSSRDKYYVKCVKKEQRPSQKILSFHESGADDVGAASEAYDRRTNMYSFYTPMQTFITPIMLSSLLTLVLISVFYLASSENESEAESGTEGQISSSRQILFLILMALAYVFMYAMTFVNGWLLHSAAIVTLIISPLLIIFGYWVIEKGQIISDEKGSRWGIVVRIIGYILIIFSVTQLVNATILTPLTKLVRFGVDTSYEYYYIVREESDDPEDWEFYIGYRVSIVTNFNNIMLSYQDGKSGEDASSVADTRGKFIMIKPGESDMLNDALKTTNPTEKKLRLTRILTAYNSKMKADNRNPLQNFINAAWKVLRTKYEPRESQDVMVSNFTKDINEVLQYLDTDPVSNDCIACDK